MRLEGCSFASRRLSLAKLLKVWLENLMAGNGGVDSVLEGVLGYWVRDVIIGLRRASARVWSLKELQNSRRSGCRSIAKINGSCGMESSVKSYTRERHHYYLLVAAASLSSKARQTTPSKVLLAGKSRHIASRRTCLLALSLFHSFQIDVMGTSV